MEKVIIFQLLLIASICTAIKYGSEVERHGAGIALTMEFLSFVGLWQINGTFDRINLLSMTSDAIGLFGYAALGIYTVRIWPL